MDGLKFLNLVDASEAFQRRILDFFYGVGRKPLSPGDCERIAARVLDRPEPISGVDWNRVADQWNSEKDRLMGSD